MAGITKETMIGELLRDNMDHIDDIAEVLMGIGMHCIGCPSSAMETIEQACAVHSYEGHIVDPDEVVARLNAVVE